MIRPHAARPRGDAAARRYIAEWRRVTVHLQVMLNTGEGAAAIAAEAHALSRQSERLAAELRALGLRWRDQASRTNTGAPAP